MHKASFKRLISLIFVSIEADISAFFERTAVFKAVSEGERDFTAIAVVGGLGDKLSEVCAPCGVCRQVLAEFCDKDMRVIMGTPEKITVSTLGELLPLSFGKSDLNKH